jgi:ribosomal protein S18 acetylase RimI-like enzyme
MSVDSIVIVPASPWDKPAVVALWRQCGLVVPHNPPEADFDFAIGKVGSDILVAREAGSIVGSVLVGHDGHRGWIYYLAVQPERQQHGLGRLLVDSAEAWLRDRGVRKLQLMVRETNQQVIGFYEAIGYERSPVTVMQRWLNR